MEYKVLIDWSGLELEQDLKIENPLEKEMMAQEENEEKLTKPSTNKSNDMMAVLKVSATAYAFGRQAGQMAVNYQSNVHQIRGESLKAERLQTQFSNTANNIGLGLGVVLSIATGNPIAIAMTAYALAQRAYNLGLDTQKYVAELSVERYRSQYYQNRLVRDISEVR